MSSNSRDPNTPNEPQVETQSTVSQQQVDIANSLNLTLSHIESRFDSIRSATQSQTEAMMQISANIGEMYSVANQSLLNTTTAISMIVDSANQVVNSYNSSYQQQINSSISDVAATSAEGLTQGSRALSELGDATKKVGDASKTLTETVTSQGSQMSDVYRQQGENIQGYNDSTQKAVEATEDFKDEMEELSESINSLTSGLIGKVGSILSGGAGMFKMAVSGASTVMSSAAKFVKFSLTLPFTIAKAASTIGNKLRTDIVETIQQAGENLKEKFDMNSTIGEGIMSLTNRGKGMLLAFQRPSSKLVKLFGMGAAGISNLIGEFGQHLESMGHFSEVFGRSLGNNQKKLENFLVLVKGLGLSSEDLAYLSLDAGTNMKHINVRLSEMNVTLKTVSDAFGVDRKRLSKNFMLLRKDITQFGHLSDEEIAKTTARLTQMKVKLEDAAAVFKKFSTFEDAANSVAILSQTFGMNLDAFDMIQAKNPEEIINMFRNSMLETGRSFQDLNRFEKDLMAQHTGMSAESLSAMMNYRDLGLTHEEAIRKMESEKPHAKQMKALKSLNSAIKEIQKVMSFTSPFEAFADGLASNATLSGDLKNAMISLSKGYEGIYEFASKLKPDTWEGITRPIKIIIDIMKDIFNSKAFRDGLVTAVETVAMFVSNMFGVSNADRIVAEIQKGVSDAVQKGGALDPKLNPKFVKDFTTAVSGVDPELLKPFEDFHNQNVAELEDPKDITNFLSKIRDIAQKSNLTKEYTALMNSISRRVQGITYTDQGTGNQKTVVQTFHTGLSNQMLSVVKLNSKNTSKLVDLSRNVMGAIIEGASVAFIAGLRLINDGIDHVKPALDKKGKKDNFIESFLKFKPGEFSKLGNLIGNELDRFLENSETIGGLTSFFIDGFKSIFKTVINVFLDVLATGIDAIFGFQFSKTPERSLSRAKMNSATGSAPSAKKNRAKIQEDISKDRSVQMDDLASMLVALDKKLTKISSEPARNAARSTKETLQRAFLSSGGSDSARRELGINLVGLSDSIKIDQSGQGTFDMTAHQSSTAAGRSPLRTMGYGKGNKKRVLSSNINNNTIVRLWNEMVSDSRTGFDNKVFKKITEDDMKNITFVNIMKSLQGSMNLYARKNLAFALLNTDHTAFTNQTETVNGVTPERQATKNFQRTGISANALYNHKWFKTTQGYAFLDYLRIKTKMKKNYKTDAALYEKDRNAFSSELWLDQRIDPLREKVKADRVASNKAKFERHYSSKPAPEPITTPGKTTLTPQVAVPDTSTDASKIANTVVSFTPKMTSQNLLPPISIAPLTLNETFGYNNESLLTLDSFEASTVPLAQTESQATASPPIVNQEGVANLNKSFLTKADVANLVIDLEDKKTKAGETISANSSLKIDAEVIDKLIHNLISRNLFQAATYPYQGVATLSHEAVQSATLNQGHGATTPTAKLEA